MMFSSVPFLQHLFISFVESRWSFTPSFPKIQRLHAVQSVKPDCGSSLSDGIGPWLMLTIFPEWS